MNCIALLQILQNVHNSVKSIKRHCTFDYCVFSKPINIEYIINLSEYCLNKIIIGSVGIGTLLTYW